MGGPQRPTSQALATEQSRSCMDGDSSAEESYGDDAYVPYVRHTFLSVPSRQRRCQARRPRSAPVKSTCDRYEAEVHALMFKLRPVERQFPRVSGASSSACGVGSPTSTSFGRSRESESEEFGDEDDELAVSSGLDSSVTGTSTFAAEEDFQMPPMVAEEEPLESVLARVPLDEAGRPTSLGSELHAVNECRPCAFLGSDQRPCQNGVRCMFCHFPHAAKRRIRLCRRKRLEMRAAVAALVAGAGTEGIAPAPRHVPIAWPVRAAAQASKQHAATTRARAKVAARAVAVL